ncbi:MAG: DUF1289 domain-containing protein [Limnohabitans sp.]
MTIKPHTIANRRWRRVAEMAQQVPHEAGPHLPSPCQSVCIMHPETGWCEGCLRSLAEIADWSRMDKPAKLAVWAQLPARLQARIDLDNAA